MPISEKFKKHIEGRKILVSGGTGTIGYEMIRNILPYNPKVIRIYSRDENKQFFMRDEFRNFPNVRFLIGDVRDKERLYRALEDIDLLFHLAAMKHVESCEYNPFEAIKTNIDGTQNIIDCSLAAGVKNVVFSSTDKAVNPSNAMGASKLMAEKLVVAANYYKGKHETIFNSIRFGNVLASSGSVVPTFLARIREGSPIEVTDFKMSRFITTFCEAVELLLTAVIEGRGGEIFIRKMPVINIKDLAEVLISEFASLYGYEDVPIKEVGCRAGEKLYEELITEEESARTYELDDYLVLQPPIGNDGYFPKEGKPFRIGSYTSRDDNVMSRQELRELLYKEQLFSNPHLMAGSNRHRRIDPKDLEPTKVMAEAT